MKKFIYISILSIFAILSISVINQNKSYATEDGVISSVQIADFSIDGFMGDAKKFIEEGKEEGEKALDKTGLQDISKVIYNTLFAVGMIAAVGIGIFLGIKLMMGSIEEKAQYKELLIPYFVGCIIVFGAFGIWKVIVNILQNTI